MHGNHPSLPVMLTLTALALGWCASAAEARFDPWAAAVAGGGSEQRSVSTASGEPDVPSVTVKGSQATTRASVRADGAYTWSRWSRKMWPTLFLARYLTR